MLRVAIIIFCAGITVPVSALAFQGPKAPSNSFVELEFGKSYTIESLAALREEQWAPHSKNSSSIITEAAASFENNPGLTSRRDTSVTQGFSIDTMWKCTAAPTIDRTMKMKITSTGGPLINDPDQYSAYVTFAGKFYERIRNVPSDHIRGFQHRIIWQTHHTNALYGTYRKCWVHEHCISPVLFENRRPNMFLHIEPGFPRNTWS